MADEDDFTMSYETGFRLFTALACLVGFFGSWLLTWMLHRRPRNNDSQILYGQEEPRLQDCFWTFLLLLIVGASASLVAWGGTARPDKEKYADGLASIIIGAILFLGSIGWMWFLIGTANHVRDRHLDPYTFMLAISLYVLLIPGLVLMAIYSKKMMFVEEHEYFGEMTIKDTAAVFKTGYRCSRGGVCNGYQGQILLRWNANCENTGAATWCDDWVTDLDCTHHTCEWSSSGTNRPSSCRIFKSDDATAIADTKQCLEEKYYPIGANNTVDAYGSCSLPCKATLGVQYGLAQNIKDAGRGMTISGVVLVVVTVIIMSCCSLRCFRRCRDQPVGHLDVVTLPKNERCTYNYRERE